MTLEEKFETWKKDILPNIISEIKQDINNPDKFKKKESDCYKVKIRKEG